MNEIELVGKRRNREKHFLQRNGIITAKVYDEDIHFFKNGVYEEIDNTLVDKGSYYINKNNSYNVIFYKDSKNKLMRFCIDDKYIDIKLKNANSASIIENITETKLRKNLCYRNILENIDFEYNIMPTKVKEAIILKNKDVKIDELAFEIETNLDLEISDDKKIIAKLNNKIYSKFDVPYMMDAKFKISNDISYKLTQLNRGSYKLSLDIDKKWLYSKETNFPIIIDPTLSNEDQNGNVYDTYIYPGDTGIDRNSEDKLKVGIENVNGNNRTNRALIKFDLPLIGTGSQVIDANINLYGYPEYPYNYNYDWVNIHRVTAEWNENSADWNTMNDKYDELVEGIMEVGRGYYDFENQSVHTSNCSADITRLVRKWYTGTPNYGIMLRHYNEVYNPNVLPIFYSKNNNMTGRDPKPILKVSYRNQNGIEDYMDYQIHDFSIGKSYVNTYNGNLINIYNIGSTIGGKMPVQLNLVYNTNDVVLSNNIGLGKGFKFNLYQTIKRKRIGQTWYLEYNDEDGTLHYFLNRLVNFDEHGYTTTETGDIYYDEDGLDMTITQNDFGYIMKDKNGNTKKFITIGDLAYLTEIENVGGCKNTIVYNNENKIIKITDANDEEINISYLIDRIVIESSVETITLNFFDGKITSIVTLKGTLNLEYEEHDLISKVIDFNLLKTVYEYYNQSPYKIKKVKILGAENTIGDFINIQYGFDSTTITNSSGKCRNLIYNSQGGIVSISNLKEANDINNAYGISQINGTSFLGYNRGDVNKLLRTELPIKYVNNLLRNTSFEENDIYFNGTNNVTLNISNDTAETGQRSLKAVSSLENQALTQNIQVEKGNFYTFSAYIKGNSNVNLKLNYLDENNNLIESDGFQNRSDNFERYEATIYYDENATSDLQIMICIDTPSTIYIDDVQLEVGEVANNYNLIENSNFSNGYSDWYLGSYDWSGNNIVIEDFFQIVDVNDNTKALRMKTDPNNPTIMSKTYNISGNGGDVYNLSFWYKNEGVDSNLSEYYGSRAYISFNYINQDDGHCGIPSPLLNPNDSAWQYVSNDFIAEKAYDSITVEICREYDSNSLYITNLSLFKDIRNTFYNYDENGNVILVNNLDDEETTFNYDKNNKLIQMTNPKGKNFSFEYDNINTSRVINGISDTGISNSYTFDNHNNPITTSITKNLANENFDNGLYRIRIKGTKKYIENVANNIKIKTKNGMPTVWLFEKEGEYFKIRHSIITNKYFAIINNKLTLSEYENDNSLFKLRKNKNGSYSFESKISNKYLHINDEEINVEDLIQDDYNFEFYVETIDYKEFIENNALYDDDNKFIKKITSTLLQSNSYTTRSSDGLLLSTTDSKGNIIEYEYDEKRRQKKIRQGEKVIEYKYNDRGLISQIIQDSRIFNFYNDEFNNISESKINNSRLSKFIYEENNGNLIEIKYGNNDNILYNYDEFGRLEKVIKENNIYQYKYNNNGDLVKIKSNDHNISYVYNLGKKLSEYNYDSFKTKYNYDENGNIISKYISMNDFNKNIIYTYNEDDNIINIDYNNFNVNFTYDQLGKINNINIANKVDIIYNYIKNGYRTSGVINKIKINDSLNYSYRYDKIGNITHIFYNDSLINKYYYNGYSELVKEIDFISNRITEYSYDVLGNILSKVIYNKDDYSFLQKFSYNYSNEDWPDLLTKYDNFNISYDSIGNPISIGNDITLNWCNGNELSSYNTQNSHINYLYGYDGNRVEKIVNEERIQYVYEGNKIILEKGDNYYVYYIYADNSIIGFEYNGNIYYYIKNLQDDVIGILDESGNTIAEYRYDSWGQIMYIKDAAGNNISNIPNHIANLNPIRYRSYYYDKETELYYINNRYYNPKWGRFINADKIIGINEDTLAYNLFTYCSNNPISCVDYNGNFKLSSITKAIKKVVNSIKKKFNNTLKLLSYSTKSNNEKKVFGENSSVSKSIINSSQFKKEINYQGAQIDSSYGNQKLVKGSVSLYGTNSDYEIDNSFAFGKVEYDLNFTRIDTKYDEDGLLYSKFKVEGTVNDYYNFDEFTWLFVVPGSMKKTLKNVANNVGFVLEKTKIIQPYNWYTTVKCETDWVPTIH